METIQRIITAVTFTRFYSTIIAPGKKNKQCYFCHHFILSIFFVEVLIVLILSGDAHASERIGPSCSRTQLAITVAELVASLRGAELDQINTMHEKTCPLIRRYHGRMVMSDWMKLQIEEAVYKGTDVTPYPEYIKGLVRDSKFELSNARQHTREYLELYNGGTARPPIHYYRKVAKKDKVEDLLTGKDLAAFKKMME